MSEKSSEWMKVNPEEKKKRINLFRKYRNKKLIYVCWLERYGKEIADQKLKDLKLKISKSSKGSNNPMFGKPSPQGSGNGWSGWYKGWFFRSFLELSYMINVIERNNWKWESAERKNLAIPYVNWKGTNRYYFTDFIINDNVLVECKPKAFWNSKDIISKSNAAKEFCKDRGWKFELIDPIRLSKKEIKILHDSNKVKFIERYEEKYKKW